MKSSEYIVYDKKTDFPLFLGNAQECAQWLGVSLSTFHYYKYKKDKYLIFNLDKLLKDYDEDEIFKQNA